MFLFIVLVMSSGVLLLYVSSIFLKSINDQMFILRVKLMEKQIFLSMISLKKNDPSDIFKGYSYLYLSKMCNKQYNKDGHLNLKDFFENYATGLWNKINSTFYQGKLIIEVCGFYYPCEGLECNRNSESMKNKIKDLMNQSHRVIVYRVSAFGQDDGDGYDTHIYYFD